MQQKNQLIFRSIIVK